jgi:hypothetical protein
MRTQRTEARVKLRWPVLDSLLKQRNLCDVHQRAAFLGVHRSTLDRLESGACGPSDRFIALALTAFPSSAFEDLFEVAVPSGQELRDAS